MSPKTTATATTASSTAQVPLYALYGPGRSGTTWLGAIINSNPHLIYRFEPFRRRQTNQSMQSAWEIIESESLSEADMEQVYRQLLLANPLLDKPPFFKKNHVRGFGQKPIWYLVRVLPQLAGLYTHIYTAQGRPPLVFKEVRWKIIDRLISCTNLKTVFLLRNPFGTVASLLKGESAGLMPTGRRDDLEKVLQQSGPHLFDELPRPVHELNNAQRNAVLWRLDADRVFDRAQQQDNRLLITYEDLCSQPVQIAQQVFEHFEIPWHAQVDRFIEASTSGGTSIRRQESGINAYFSVSRDTAKVSHKWKQELTPTDIQAIEEIVGSSQAYQYMTSGSRTD
jgi:hypothetical protein